MPHSTDQPQGEVWAITESGLRLAIEAKGKADSPEQLAFMMGGNAYDPVDPYENRNGLALLPLRGVFTKHAWWPGDMGGGDEIRANLQKALDDPLVDGILMVIDSPGGTVDGTLELADFIHEAGQQKPIYAYADGLMASAAYWLGSQARKIYAPATADVGSIGVMMTHLDWSRNLDDMGIKITHLHAGHFKVMGNDVEPLSDEAKVYLQAMLDDTYDLFLSAVERGRGIDREAALAMADGKIFPGREAQKVGLVDVIANLDQAVRNIKEDLGMDLKTLSADQLRSERPDLVTSIEADISVKISETNEQAATEAMEQGASSERERILSLHKAVHGDDSTEQFTALVESGVSGDQAAAVLATAPKPGKGVEAELLKGIEAAHEDELEPTSRSGDAQVSDFHAVWDKDADLRAEFGDDFDRFAAYTQAHKDGLCRVQGQDK